VNGGYRRLNRIIDLIFPDSACRAERCWCGAWRISDLTDIAYYRDMVTIVRDRVQDMIKRA